MGRLLKAEEGLAGSGTKHLVLDLEKCDYIGPDGASLIAKLYLFASKSATKIEVLAPRAPAELRNYLRYSGLDHLFNTGNLDTTELDQERRVLPLEQFGEARFTDSNKVVQLIKHHHSLTDDLEEYLRICINEVLQNVQDHAESSIGAVMTARYLRGAREIRIAIVDAGKGICRTLKTKYPETTPELSLKRVLKGGYSAMSRENNLGLGISNLCNIVSKQLNGEIYLVSDRASLEIAKGRNPNIRSLDFSFKGTAAFFTLPV